MPNHGEFPSVRGSSERQLTLAYVGLSSSVVNSELALLNLSCAWTLEGSLLVKKDPVQLDSLPHLQFYLNISVEPQKRLEGY